MSWMTEEAVILTDISLEYFDWLYDIACGSRFSPKISYRKLLRFLHRTPFRWELPRDEDRARDGVDLRYRFAGQRGYSDNAVDCYLTGPCSVLEMLVALAIRCEENIMDNPRIGDRTGQWIWSMINNLELGSMTDTRFDKRKADLRVARFLDRAYCANGRGGLFTIRRTRQDLRNVEIWTQLCWYLDSIDGL